MDGNYSILNYYAHWKCAPHNIRIANTDGRGASRKLHIYMNGNQSLRNKRIPILLDPEELLYPEPEIEYPEILQSPP